MSLRAIGFPLDKMRIVVVQDENLGVAHGIFAGYINGKPYILDNQIKQILPSKKIHHYKPFFSVNEKYWWLHRGKIRPAPALESFVAAPAGRT